MSHANSSTSSPADQPGIAVGALVRTRRRARNMTLQELGHKVDLSVGYLSQIERDIAIPSIGSLTRIAHALGLELGHFMSNEGPRGLVSRAHERETTWIRKGGMTYERLHAEFPGATFSAYIITLPPGFVGEVDNHEGEEFVQVRSGRFIFEVDGTRHDLGPGDALHFRSDMRHQASNPYDEEVVITWLGNAPALRLRPDAESGNG
ncbi:helix-turn-helix domain-containing protein [Pelagovum pacificum]|uniref:Helix-turn-helix transcriptional regulator n=1 Tax=Pelagovum pacificum TaxID=2588711 RepID=A0A5C5GFP2_9RHOB|nr:XRE family transcriptional regulator [Pelagovum pacificum]QQA43836.1 cupin domain-containing protein [Pelagovum pacificum]TNY33034.1 helix-turn-helix transcriptional regulator [Pelagovum pacificum]